MQTPPTNAGGTPGNTQSKRSELKRDASRVGQSAANRIHSEIDSRKGEAASQAKTVSSAIDRAAGEMNDAPEWLKSAFQRGAEQVRQFADTIEQKDSRQLLQDVQSLARNNPGAFLAGCAALGFAAARVFKAGSPDSAPSWSGSDFSPEASSAASSSPGSNDEPVFRNWGSEATRSPTPAGDI